jgi:hypothetical protein
MVTGEVHTGLRLRNLTGRGHLESPGVDGSIILKWAFKKRDEGMDCIDLAQERDRWWALVNGVMNFRFPQNAVYFLLVGDLLASQEGLRFMKLLTLSLLLLLLPLLLYLFLTIFNVSCT